MPAANTSATLPQAPQPGRKYFSLAEANRALPYVSRVADDVCRVYGRVVELRRHIEHPGAGEPIEQLEAQYEHAMGQLSDLVDELHLVGVELRDFEHGLIDFPAMYHEREVFLSWRRGESQVSHWHEVDAAHDDRQPAELLDT